MNDIYVPPYLKENRVSHTSKNCYVPEYIKPKSKRGLNKYFSFNNENYETSMETSMVQDLQEEHIRIHGYTFVYIIRTNNTLDELYGESIGSTFKHSFEIEMIPETPELMIGRDTLASYGYAMTDTVQLHCSYRRIKEEISRLNVDGRTLPMAGDLIAWLGMNVGNLMEIRYVEDKVIPFLKNEWTMYNFTCQVFNLGQETFDTGNQDIDFLNTFNRNYNFDNADNEEIHKESKEVSCKEPNIWNIDFTKDLHYGK